MASKIKMRYVRIRKIPLIQWIPTSIEGNFLVLCKGNTISFDVLCNLSDSSWTYITQKLMQNLPGHGLSIGGETFQLCGQSPQPLDGFFHSFTFFGFLEVLDGGPNDHSSLFTMIKDTMKSSKHLDTIVM